ncbi:DEAD/DEAH box helicase [Moheibacter sediminis]|uniref:ATP-dependent RNA helicase RhlE n=1 Tax=Moheibacter sediminis TaxID=1434700 RepID=A0A1W2BQ74_9FLAO|nr:DEAD/DEAH box helicase [Moheibacter sediminis]SMC75145.1 ATP-dependent RNA helicase RhlE [Moheibacter sediminis]
MDSFQDFNLSKQLQNAIDDLNFSKPTPIQAQSYSVILSGKDMVGIAQTGTGKTFAYMLPILNELSFSKQVSPRVLVLVPTRELVVQVVSEIEKLTKYNSIRVLGVYGGVNMNTQKIEVEKGMDVLVATPGRLYDLALCKALSLKTVKKLVIDEVDVMLDLGFRFQLTNIFELLPQRRQNIMFSATMTEEIDTLINDFFANPAKISVAVSGTPLENIKQEVYPVQNFYTKVNLLSHLLKDRKTFHKVLVFVSNKKRADLLFEALNEEFGEEIAVIHSNKTQNYRIRSIRQFDEGQNRILVSTDVMARGLDLINISHVINFDTPAFPENYMHRIGRSGRAGNDGNSILFYTETEMFHKQSIEELMDYQIPEKDFPEEVEISTQLTWEEQPKDVEMMKPLPKKVEGGASFHEKKEKNKKVNLGGSYHREIAKKYKKAKTRGDKNFNKRNKKK